MTPPSPKHLMFIFRSNHDDAHTTTGLDAALLAGAFEREVSLLLIGEAVKLLTDKRAENNPLLARLPQLKDFGIKHIYVDREALQQFPIDLLVHQGFLVPADRKKITQLIHSNQTVSF